MFCATASAYHEAVIAGGTRALKLLTASLVCLAACSSDASRRPDASDASRDEHSAGDVPAADAVADVPATNTDATSARIQTTASQCVPSFCPSERCLGVAPATCNALPCPGFSAYQCPIDCAITVDCDGAEVCVFPGGAERNCGG